MNKDIAEKRLEEHIDVYKIVADKLKKEDTKIIFVFNFLLHFFYDSYQNCTINKL